MKIRQRGIITESLKGSQFRVKLEDDATHMVMATPCGKIKIRRIHLCIGDEVSVELSPYDLRKGRILWRF